MNGRMGASNGLFRIHHISLYENEGIQKYDEAPDECPYNLEVRPGPHYHLLSPFFVSAGAAADCSGARRILWDPSIDANGYIGFFVPPSIQVIT